MLTLRGRGIIHQEVSYVSKREACRGRYRLQVVPHRPSVVMGSFWFGGSFKLAESIQRQEFAVVSILSSTLVIGVGGWVGGALLGEFDASVLYRFGKRPCKCKP